MTMLEFILRYFAPVIMIVITTVLYGHRKTDATIFCYLVTILAFFISCNIAGYWTPLKSFDDIDVLISSMVIGITLYVLAGVITSFVYWVIFNIRSKIIFDQLYEIQKNQVYKYFNIKNDTFDTELFSLCLKYQVLINYDNRSKIFDNFHEVYIRPVTVDVKSVINNRYTPENAQEAKQRLTDVISEIIPPKFEDHNYHVIYSGIVWPITLIHLITYRAMRFGIDMLVKAFNSIYDAISKKIW